MTMDAQGLLKLKKRIDEAKESVSQLKGQQTALMKQLKDEWRCGSVAAAEKKIQEMKEELTKMEKSIEKGLMELEERYGEDN